MQMETGSVESNPCPCSTDQGGGDNDGGGNNNPPPPIKVQRAKIVRVIDGDTMKVDLAGGPNVTVRLLGIDTPEVYGGKECWGPQASRFAKKILPRGSRIVLRSDRSQPLKDRYNRLLRYMQFKKYDISKVQLLVGQRQGSGRRQALQQVRRVTRRLRRMLAAPPWALETLLTRHPLSSSSSPCRPRSTHHESSAAWRARTSASGCSEASSALFQPASTRPVEERERHRAVVGLRAAARRNAAMTSSGGAATCAMEPVRKYARSSAAGPSVATAQSSSTTSSGRQREVDQPRSAWTRVCGACRSAAMSGAGSASRAATRSATSASTSSANRDQPCATWRPQGLALRQGTQPLYRQEPDPLLERGRRGGHPAGVRDMHGGHRVQDPVEFLWAKDSRSTRARCHRGRASR